MRYFILGVIVTLAILYPSITKEITGSLIDFIHNIVSNAIHTP